MSKENLVEYSHDFDAAEQENFDFEGEDLDGQAEVDATEEPVADKLQPPATHDPEPNTVQHDTSAHNGEQDKPPAEAV